MSELQRLLNNTMLENQPKRKKGGAASVLGMLGPTANNSTIRKLVKQALQEELAADARGGRLGAGLGAGLGSAMGGLGYGRGVGGEWNGVNMSRGAGPVGGYCDNRYGRGGQFVPEVDEYQKRLAMYAASNSDADFGNHSLREPRKVFKRPYKSEDIFSIGPRVSQQLLPHHAAQKALKGLFMMHDTKQPFAGEQRKQILAALRQMYNFDESFASNVEDMIGELAKVLDMDFSRYKLTHKKNRRKTFDQFVEPLP